MDLARNSTAGSRPVIVRQGHEADPNHLTSTGETQCWYDYVIIPSG